MHQLSFSDTIIRYTGPPPHSEVAPGHVPQQSDRLGGVGHSPLPTLKLAQMSPQKPFANVPSTVIPFFCSHAAELYCSQGYWHAREQRSVKGSMSATEASQKYPIRILAGMKKSVAGGELIELYAAM